MGTLLAICISESRTLPKKPVENALFLKDTGIDGDSHSGIGTRQISLLRKEDIEEAEKESGFSFPPGALAENIVVSGLPGEIEKGMLLKLGSEVILEFIEKGKRPDEPHSYDYRGWCLLPTKGYFLRVRKGGYLSSPAKAELENSCNLQDQF